MTSVEVETSAKVGALAVEVKKNRRRDWSKNGALVPEQSL